MNLSRYNSKITITISLLTLVFMSLFISGCKWKKSTTDNIDVITQDKSALTDKTKSICDEFVILSGSFDLKYFGNENLVVCKYTITTDKKNDPIETILKPLREIYTNSEWTIQDTVDGNNFITFSGTKPGKYLTVTLIIEKRKRPKITVHSSISISDRQDGDR